MLHGSIVPKGKGNIDRRDTKLRHDNNSNGALGPSRGAKLTAACGGKEGAQVGLRVRCENETTRDASAIGVVACGRKLTIGSSRERCNNDASLPALDLPLLSNEQLPRSPWLSPKSSNRDVLLSGGLGRRRGFSTDSSLASTCGDVQPRESLATPAWAKPQAMVTLALDTSTVSTATPTQLDFPGGQTDSPRMSAVSSPPPPTPGPSAVNIESPPKWLTVSAEADRATLRWVKVAVDSELKTPSAESDEKHLREGSMSHEQQKPTTTAGSDKLQLKLFEAGNALREGSVPRVSPRNAELLDGLLDLIINPQSEIVDTSSPGLVTATNSRCCAATESAPAAAVPTAVVISGGIRSGISSGSCLARMTAGPYVGVRQQRGRQQAAAVQKTSSLLRRPSSVNIGTFNLDVATVRSGSVNSASGTLCSGSRAGSVSSIGRTSTATTRSASANGIGVRPNPRLSPRVLAAKASKPIRTEGGAAVVAAISSSVGGVSTVVASVSGTNARCFGGGESWADSHSTPTVAGSPLHARGGGGGGGGSASGRPSDPETDMLPRFGIGSIGYSGGV
eukprot:TRINITY_DN51158_c0_g1_i1.p1 TRINITY_DN51158_c0_g1~~TRINITY_DN51158_c0_g1_i1.p1  ORF type:complete len:600 (+),score=118.89 TRINITY_DN51158_c0_g1_i1:111-1802(+)